MTPSTPDPYPTLTYSIMIGTDFDGTAATETAIDSSGASPVISIPNLASVTAGTYTFTVHVTDSNTPTPNTAQYTLEIAVSVDCASATI